MEGISAIASTPAALLDPAAGNGIFAAGDRGAESDSETISARRDRKVGVI
jgi:hypothetical protein